MAIITGAGSGIGRATAIALSEAGYAVVLAGRDEAKLGETAAKIGGAAMVLIQPTDVCDPVACAALVNTAADQYGRIDALVNNAGFGLLTSITQIDDATWRQILDTNLSAALYLTRAAWPIFRTQRRGVVVNVSSMSSIDPYPGLGLYGVAKIGLNMLTKITADEGAAAGIRAVAIAPGAVDTPMLRSVFDYKSIPKGAALEPADVAAVIRDCITGKRKFEPAELITVQA